MQPPTPREGHRATALMTPARPITAPAELSRAVRELWTAAAALGALAFALRLTVLFWMQPIAWRMSTTVGMLTMLSGTVLAAGLPAGAYATLVRRHRRLPRTFVRQDGPTPATLRRIATALNRIGPRTAAGPPTGIRVARIDRALLTRLTSAWATVRRAGRRLATRAATVPAGRRALALAVGVRTRLRRALVGRAGGAHAADARTAWTAHRLPAAGRRSGGGAHAAPDDDMPSAAFIAPATPWLGLYVVMGMAVAAGAVVTTRTVSDEVDVAPLGWLPAVVLVEAMLTIVVWFTLRGSAVALTAEGLVVRGLWSGPRGRTISWDDLVADRLPAPSRRAWQVRLPVRASHGARRRAAIAVGSLWINPVFLLAAIRHYARHPEFRAAIGTRPELDRLQQVLRDAVTPSGTPSAARAR